jgi:acyl transferase domain-containing protein/NADPH:quinone reductase-like Zn-dependent oxidoreductase/NAD(P)-dependent dehydrogenase (short-subunit alcohol dehydrogenase family)/acyl carrier protein
MEPVTIKPGSLRDARVTPVAVIGMACRLPGGIDSPGKLWESLLRGDDLVTEIPAERWDADEYYDPEPGVPGRSVSRWGGFLDDITGFDAAFFGFGEREAAAIDPQHRLLLETAWEAIEHAGLAPRSLTGSRTGVFVGLSHDDYTLVKRDAGALGDPYGFSGDAFCMASGRIAYGLGLHGPAITVDTACSSGLLTVHMACGSLDGGESDLALAGGSMVMLEPSVSSSASAQGMLSPTGRCHAFDVAADGFVRSEGCAMVLLKRLPDALRDGDRILAVIRGTAANQDGRTETIATPSVDAQVAVYRAALTAAGVDAAAVGFVEAHGTGTPVGDPIEFTSLTRVYGVGGRRCALGSVKSNLGHTEAAAGTVGLMKAILAVGHGVVPAMMHFNRLPDDLERIETGLFVPPVTTSWPIDVQTPRRAAVSSFGMSGTNVHAIVEQAPDEVCDDQLSGSAPQGQLVFPLSATSVEELRASSRRLAEWVEAHAAEVAPRDLGYTLARRCAHRPVRTTVVASGLAALAGELHAIAEDETPYPPAVGQDDRGPVWVFSGQGSQWAAMGAELLAREPVFAACVAEAEPLIAREAGFSVTEAMTAPHTVVGIDRVQPTLFAMQVALATAMRSYGVAPGAVIGHSLGEVAAAVVAGALALEDGVRVICRRSRLCARLAGAGAMASVELPAQRVRTELDARGVTDVVVSVVASPQSTVVGGATQAVRNLVAAWEQRGVMAREVAVDVASHSPQVDPILGELADVLADLTPMTPAVPFYSATLDDARGEPAFDARYWVDNLRQPVRLAAAVQAALEDGHRVFGELAPHPLLVRAVEQIAQATDHPAQALPCMRREQELPHGLRRFVSDVHCAGAAVDFSALYPSGRLVDSPLPTWTRRRLVIESDGHNQVHGARIIVVHPLLGAHVELLEEPERHAWRGDVGTTALPWLRDHRILTVPALPGAAFCEMALTAARTILGEPFEVRDIRFHQMLLLNDQTPVAAVACVAAPGVVDFAVQTDQEGEHTRRATAVLCAASEESDEPQPPQHDIPSLLAAHPTRTDGTELRRLFDSRGVQLGPAFAGLIAAYTAGNASTLVAEIGLPVPLRSQQGAYGVHPALLDACFQSVAALPAVRAAGDGGLLLPSGVRRLRICGPTRNARYCYARATAHDRAGVEADLDVLDESGTVVLTARGLRMVSRADESGERDRVLAERLLTIGWHRRALPAMGDNEGGNWLLVTTSSSDSSADDPMPGGLAAVLKSLGVQCDTLHWPQLADHLAIAGNFVNRIHAGIDGVVVLFGPTGSVQDEGCLVAGRENVRHLVRIVRELTELPGDPPRLYVLTRGTQKVLSGDQPDLGQAGLRGVLRVIGAEHPQLRPTQIDVDATSEPDLVAAEFLSGSEEDETAWRDGQWYTARLATTPLRPDERRISTVDPERDGVRLEIRTPGDLETLELTAVDRGRPGPGQIEVAVGTSSINFADVLVAMGRQPGIDGRAPALGIDFEGVVTAVGPDVTGHRVGDRVSGLSGYGNGSWGTLVTVDARLAAAVPPGLAAGQAAAVSVGYGTAWHGLVDLARIETGDRVLIHSGTGGVGQAAIAVARLAGAEIFATAGGPRRRALLREMGIEHVYDSRTTEFADLIREETNGYGVDIVLNSLTGAAQRAGLELLSSGGRFVEIGKKDVYRNARLELYPFRHNLTFHYLDLALMCDTHPQRIQKLMRTVFTHVADGVLPRPQCTDYPLTGAATAIRVMSAAEHTGKLLLNMPRVEEIGRSRVVVPPERAGVFRRDGAYIITGGLGGLGMFLAADMAAAGCGRIVLTGRSQPTRKAQQTIARIRATGADIEVVCGNIAEPATASGLVDVATATGLPLRGVLHAAAVIEDGTLTNLTDEVIDRDWAPKVYGAWHLHHATATQPLDWFCSFSSITALLGAPGQSAYAAANSWLDAFTHWRRDQGHPATTVAWGVWAEIGRGAPLAESGHITMITPAEGAHAFQTLLRHDRAYTGYIPTVGAPWLTALVERGSPFAEAFEAIRQNSTGTASFRSELESLSHDEWPSRFRRLVAEQAGLILRRTVDPDRSFSDHGLDSLGNLELRTRIETETGLRITPKTVATHNTVQALAGHLFDQLSAQPTR